MPPMISKVYIRGCPGHGTTWFTKAVKCLFVGAITVFDSQKHDGCHINSATDPFIMGKLAHPDCKPHDCVHAVIARHPTQHKSRATHAGFNEVWEAYYGAWARATNVTNARFFRYDDLIRPGLCTSKQTNNKVARAYLARQRPCLPIGNQAAWKFWNYTNDGCVGQSATATAGGRMRNGAGSVVPPTSTHATPGARMPMRAGRMTWGGGRVSRRQVAKKENTVNTCRKRPCGEE